MHSSQGYSPPQKKNRMSIAFKPYIRKFPGPAGLSPDPALGEMECSANHEKESTKVSNNSVLVGSTYSNVLLSKPCYQRLVEDFGLSEGNSPLNQFTLQMISKMFSRKTKRDLKVPFLGLLVSSISKEHGVSLKLMDTTFEVNSVVHQETWEEIGAHLEVNSAIALIEVPVIASCTTRPPITLFISKKNILRLYMDAEDDQTEVKTFQRVPLAQLKNNCQEWLTRLGVTPSAKKPEVLPVATSNDGPSKMKFDWNPDEFLADVDFAADDFGEVKTAAPVVPGSSHLEEGGKSDSGFVEGSNERTPLRSSTQPEALSPSEKLMVQEVLSGIDFDDFE